jgi:membrane AbrB-like protein
MNIDYILNLILLLCIGGAGAVVGHRLKVPAGVFIGSIISVGAYQVIFGTIMGKPHWIRLIAQIAVGLVLGTKFTQSFLLDFKRLIKPIIVACVTLICTSVLLGILLSYMTGLDLATSILSTAPGGQAEMAVFSDSIGAQTEKVIVLQLVRNQLVLIGIMPLAKILFRNKEKGVD